MKKIIKATLLPLLPDQLHKGTAGRVLCIGGSVGMSGSIIMSAKASLRAGAGLVTIACPKEIGDIAETASLESMTIYCRSTKGQLNKNAWKGLKSIALRSNSILIGPGIGRTKDTLPLLKHIIDLKKQLVIDADALAAFKKIKPKTQSTIVLTPHIGEMNEIIGQSLPEAQNKRKEISINYAKENKVILVLKSHCTIVTDGVTIYEEQSGNPGMAKGGSGDILAGTIAAFLLLQDQMPFMNVIRAVHLHSFAADLATKNISQRSLIATDIINQYGIALKKLELKN